MLNTITFGAKVLVNIATYLATFSLIFIAKLCIINFHGKNVHLIETYPMALPYQG